MTIFLSVLGWPQSRSRSV